MKITTPLLFFLLRSLPVSVYAGAVREVELSDGSVLQAEVVGMRHGAYQLRSSTLGEFEVPESQVVAIRTPHSEPAPAPASEWDGDVASPQPQQNLPAAGALQQALTQDPAALNKILSPSKTIRWFRASSVMKARCRQWSPEIWARCSMILRSKRL